ncbi:putative zinc-binding protein [Planctomycetota bacterium]
MGSEQVCQGGETLIFACSGAADVGAIADIAARKLTKEGIGKMFCLAGVGGRVAPIMEKTKAATQILAIDGCGLDCVRCTLDQAGIANYEQIRVTDLGLVKGQSPATDANAEVVVTQGKAMLNS